MENFDALLDRAFLFLEDKEWKRADEYFEKLLDLQPRNAQVYLGKLLAELQIKNKDELKNSEISFDNSNNYEKIMRFGNEELKTFLTESAQFVNERKNNEKLESTYNLALNIMANRTIDAYAQAKTLFDSICGYKNADSLAKECALKEEELANEIKEKYIAEQKRLADEKAEQEAFIKTTKLQNQKRCKTAALTAIFLCICLLLNILLDILTPNKYISLSIGNHIIVAVKRDGSVTAIGESEIIEEINEWINIKSVAVGLNFAVGLKKDGTLVFAGNNARVYEKAEKWENIIDISAYLSTFAALKKDGTVLISESVPDGYDPDKIDDIVESVISDTHTKTTETSSSTLRFEKLYWDDVVSVTVGQDYVVGIKNDGTIVSTNESYNFEEWDNITSVSFCHFFAVGLKKDGTVITDCEDEKIKKDLESLEDVIYLSCGTYLNDFWSMERSTWCVIAIKKDGELVCHSNDDNLTDMVEKNIIN